jgi:hypothetical protein
LAGHSEKKHDWQHILGKNLIDSTFCEKHDWQHILRKKMIDGTFWEKT